MQANESGARLVLQPETEVEQSALVRLRGWFDRLKVTCPPPWWTVDVEKYPDLDHDLADQAVWNPATDRYDVGARALVIPDGGGDP